MFRCILALTTLIVLPQAALGQGSYPDQEITILVPLPPGGSTDLTARALAPVLEKVLGQPVVVVNRAGAAASIGIQAAAIAEPDGYTLLMSTTHISVLPPIDEVFSRPPAFTRDQFRPIARISADSTLLAVNASQPWTTTEELVEAAKSTTEPITYASGGLYGATHLPVEMFTIAAGIEMRHLPTAGGGPALTAVLGNNAQLLSVHPGVAKPQIEAGTIRPIASWGAERLAEFPDVPTLQELGYDVEYYLWQGLFAQAGVSDEIAEVLEQATREAVEDPEFQQAMANAGSVVAYQGVDEFQTWWDEDSDRLAEIVKSIGRVE